MKAIYKLHFDCGRQGELTGLFIAEKEKVEKLIESGIEVSFGEVLGKHSDVCGPIEESDITLVSDNTDLLIMFIMYNLETGYNPFEYESYSLEGYEGMLVEEIIDKLLENK